jgi:hypothetical protein
MAWDWCIIFKLPGGNYLKKYNLICNDSMYQDKF